MKAYSYESPTARASRSGSRTTTNGNRGSVCSLISDTQTVSAPRPRETGDVRTKPIPGRPAQKGAALQAGLPSQLDAYPDATRGPNIARSGKRRKRVQVSSTTMSRALQRLNWTRKKKTLRASEQKEEDRAAWREQAQRLPARKLVFIDECGSNFALTRLYARSRDPENESMVLFHAIDEPISRFWPLFPIRRMGEAFILEGSADAVVFELSIEQILAPSLQAGPIVIQDHLSTHIGARVRRAIEARGCQLLFLPSYSPDLSPIEEAFSQLKAVLRRVGAGIPEALQEAIGQALLTITPHDAAFLVYALWLSLPFSIVFPKRGLAHQTETHDVCFKACGSMENRRFPEYA